MNSYREAFHLVYVNGDNEQEVVVECLEESEGNVRLAVKTVWSDPIRKVTFDLAVPVVTPVPFKGDNGIHGHVIRLPWSTAERFCHPMLVSNVMERIAAEGDPFALKYEEESGFYWINWYGRIRRMAEQTISELMTSQRKPTPQLVHMYFRTRLSNLITPNEERMRTLGWSDGGSVSSGGLPLTDEATILRQMHEVRLGYPDCPGNDLLYELIKMKYLEHVDGMCDITFTGKNHTGREVIRVFDGDPTSHITGRPMPRLALALNPLDAIANPARVHRENRSCQGWLLMESPIEPPLKARGFKMPKPFRDRVTTVITAFIDIPGFNVFAADEQDLIDFGDRVEYGEEISLDGLLVTRTGQEKLKARTTRSEMLTAEEFLSQQEELQELPGFRFEEIANLVEVLADGTPIFNTQYRYWHDVQRRCRYDKVKVLVGGIKGVTRPIRQLYAEMNGELVPIDLVISERTMLSKCANDGFRYPMAANAGLTEIDPAWTQDEIDERIEEGLKERGLPTDGRFPIYASRRVPMLDGKEIDEQQAATLEAWGKRIYHKTVRVLIGHAVVGPVPVVRAQETEFRQSKANQGMSLNCHSRVLGGVEFPHNERTAEQIADIVRFFNTHCDVCMEVS
jgi:hypothetical protein